MLYAVIAISLFMIAIIILWRFDRAEITELYNNVYNYKQKDNFVNNSKHCKNIEEMRNLAIQNSEEMRNLALQNFEETHGLVEDRFKEVYNVVTRTNLTDEQISTYLEELELYKNFAISIDAAVNAAVISLDTYKKQREYLFKQIDKLESALHNE